ncbi:MAG: DUF4249 family protein [Balneolaceae bacterium]|nr:DUF4249 family protein [Balneolaceae bacterium]
MIKSSIPAFVILLLLSAAGCELYPQDEFEEDYVVESYLVANRPLPQIRISKTTPIDSMYDFTDAAVTSAEVEVRLLDENGNADETFEYGIQSTGVYVTGSSHRVLPRRRYELYVTFRDAPDEIRAQTFVPGQFGSVGNTVDSIAYQDPAQIVINTSRSYYPNRQSFFIFSVVALQPEPGTLTPFYADQLNNEDTELSNFYTNSSGIINEQNYEENENNTLTLRVPWLAVAFYGDTYIIANAIDDNMYDFYRTQDVQGGGSTLPPGEFQNVIYNVEGGIGVFGSMASDTVRVYIRRNEN